MNKIYLPVLLAAICLLSGRSVQAQELVAWPVGSQNVFRHLLPGMPIRLTPRPRPLPMPVAPVPVALSDYRVQGKLTDSAAELGFDITFHNPGAGRLEGVLLIPLPADTVLSGFNMTVGGKKMNAELLESGKAAAVYENIVRQLRDPGLLELVGERLLRARVFPIEPNSDVQVHLELSQILSKSGGLYSVKIPMRSASMLNGASGRVSASLTLAASRPIRTIYSPWSSVSIRRAGPRNATIGYEEKDGSPAGDLNLFYSLQEDPLAASIVTFKEEGEDGYFLLSLSPKPEPMENAALAKDIVFVVDRSGSMEENGKIDQAKAALSYCINRLGAADRFGIIDFATDSASLESRLLPATKENKARALRYIKRLEAAGGTNIEAGLSDAFALLTRSEKRVPMVFFLTDGIPTEGQTQVEGLLAEAAEKNKAVRARLFAFGIGDDVNTLLLDKLASANRGSRDYVAGGENIESKVSALYQKVAKPALNDVRIDWEGVSAAEVYPRPISDIFYGGELVLMGRYQGHGKGMLVVSGLSAGKKMAFRYPVELPKESASNDFLPRLWANLKVTHELDAVRLSGKMDPEVIASITRLAKRYGIVTPYTSYLITEEGKSLGAANQVAQQGFDALHMAAAQSGFSGGAAMAQKARSASMFFKRAAAPEEMDAAMLSADKEVREDLKAKGIAAAQTRSLGGKTFYLRGGSWVDGEYETAADNSAREIRYLSEEYFLLLTAEPGLRRYLSLGSRIIVIWKDIAYRIVE